ncbi:MAG: hypothetical protein ACM3YE_04020 [Bacteroidota bacterium]
MLIRDKIIRGAIIGICADIAKLVFNYFCYLMGWTPVLFWQIAATRFLDPVELFQPAAFLIGGAADLTVSAALGIAFLYLLEYTHRRFRWIKGAGFGLLVWVGLFGTILGQSAQNKLPITSTTVVVTLFAHFAFGLSLALFDLLIDGRKIKH